MRDMTRKQRCEMRALENMLHREPKFQKALVSDYAIARAQVHSLQGKVKVLVQQPEPGPMPVQSGVFTPISPRRTGDRLDLPGGASSDWAGCIA